MLPIYERPRDAGLTVKSRRHSPSRPVQRLQAQAEGTGWEVMWDSPIDPGEPVESCNAQYIRLQSYGLSCTSSASTSSAPSEPKQPMRVPRYERRDLQAELVQLMHQSRSETPTTMDDCPRDASTGDKPARTSVSRVSQLDVD